MGILSFLVLWAILALPTLAALRHHEWPTQPGPCGHLQWSFLQPMLASPMAPMYWVTMLGAWLFMKPWTEGLWYAAMAVGSLGITWALFPGEWGSLWCFLANALPLGRIL